jgi:hypothetical protein
MYSNKAYLAESAGLGMGRRQWYERDDDSRYPSQRNYQSGNSNAAAFEDEI